MMRRVEADTIAARDASGAAQAASSSSLRQRAAASADLIVTVALADLRARFGRGHGRFVKWLIDPFAVSGVYLVFVVLILDRGGPQPGLSLACAVVPFQLFLQTIFRSLTTTRDKGALILNAGFRRDLIPAATTCGETLGFISSLTLLALMMGLYGVPPTLATLWLPVVLALTVFLALAVSYPAALFGLWFVEMIGFAQSATRVFFFLAPGVVALSQIEGEANELVRLNPLSGIFEAYRDVLAYGQSPAAWELLYPFCVSVLLLLVFFPVFRREAAHLAKVV
jgi:ABC-type polysaccharide/polyol phosphate export permease